jgi:hypothetical protein
MMSTPRRFALTRLAVPLLALSASPVVLSASTVALLTGCNGAPATTDDADGSGTGTSTGETGDEETVGTPTTGDDPGPPVEHQQRYFLHVDDTPPPPLPAIELNKEKTLEVFGETAAREIHLIDVDSGPLIKEVLARILASCGDAWDDYEAKPNDELPVDAKLNCGLTELGKSFGDTEAARKLSPEYQMVRLLTMTPRNARVGGTIMNDMELLFASNDNNFGEFSFQDVLAASLFCPHKQGESADLCTDKLKSNHPNQIEQEMILHVRPFIGTDVLAETLTETLVASHPNIPAINGVNGLLSVSLYDALKDMQPLAEKFGPDAQSGHPGLLKPDDDTFTTHSDALTAQFKMIAFTDSNLRRVEGIDASVGAGELYVNIVTDPDTSDDVHPAPIRFDFNNKDKVRIEGLTANPTVDMRMQLFEIDGMAEPGTLAPVPSCDGTHGDDTTTCKSNLPATPVGDQYVWSQPVWSLEYIIAHAAHASFKTRSYNHCFVNFGPDCLTDASIGIAPEPPGWTVFTADLMTPKFPPQQFFWEMLLNVAQQSLHDFVGANMTKAADGTPEIEEGALNPTFTLRKLPIGLTSAELEEALRPNLQKQADKLANTVLGGYWKNNARLDFYYRRGNKIDASGGPPLLFFVARSDLRPSKDDPESLSNYGYANPGFFSDRELTKKVSNTDLGGIGDKEHEKFQLKVGESTLYMQDDEGVTYELNFLVPKGDDPTEIVVRVTPQ